MDNRTINGLNTNLPTKKYLDCLPSFKDLDLFALNGFLLDKNSDFNTLSPAISCKYYSPHSFFQLKEHMQPSSFPKFSLFHTNIQSLRRNFENFQTHLLEELDFRFNIIGITETRIKNEYANLDFNPTIPLNNFEYVSTPLSAGGVGMYIDEELKTQLLKNVLTKLFRLFGLRYIYQKIAI